MSLSNATSFTGISTRGDFNEALEEAVALALHHLGPTLVRWELKKTTGVYGGFVNARNLAVTIEVSGGGSGVGGGGSSGSTAVAAGDGSTSGTDGPLEVPVFLSGPIFKIEIDFCQDGAEYLLNTFVRQYRLRPTNDEARNVLEKASINHEAVAIAGYWRSGPECNYIDVYYAGPIREAFQKIGGGEAPR